MSERAAFGRRRLLVGASAAAGLLASGCDPLISLLSRRGGHGFAAAALPSTDGPLIDPAFHLLSRAAFGPRPGDLTRVRAMGARAWVERQLQPEQIDDGMCDLRARRFESLHVAAGELFEFKRQVVRDELTRATLLRAVYSERQLLEVMVRFWSDHLNIDMSKEGCSHLKTADDRDVIRKHALGRFRDLIRASALSPAMLIYLDGTQNKRRNPTEVPNENYARELLELHTLGIGGGYTQKDVMEAARCLTGWRVRREWRKGEVVFDPSAHDDGHKLLLGQSIAAGGGEGDLERLLDIVCGHPSAALHIASKLCRRFVADEPPAALVRRATQVFVDSSGDIKAVLRELLLSDELAAARGGRLKRPFRFVVSALRALAADTHAKRPLLAYLERLGQPLFHHPTPDGYPDEPSPWMATLLWRWNFAMAITGNQIEGVAVQTKALERALRGGDDDISLQRVFSYFVGRSPREQEARALESMWAADRRLALGLILSSPAFQRH